MNILRSHAAYSFAVFAGILLMVLEQRISDQAMIVLICAAVIAHVWLTRRAVREIANTQADAAVDATLSIVSAAHRAMHPRDE